MDFTVRDILNLEVLKGIDVVAGKQGIDNKVAHVTVLDAPDAAKWIRGYEFVVTTLYLFKDTSEQLKLIEDMSQRNASALGIKLNRFVNALSSEVIDLADKYCLPLIRIPYEKAWIDLINPIMAELLNQQVVMLEKSNAIRRSFINEVLEGGKLETIARTLSGLTHNPVTLVELINKTDVTWPYYFKNHINTDDLHSLQRKHNGIGLANKVKSIINNINGYVYPIEVAKRVEGYVIVWETKELKELDLIAIEQATTVAALHIQQLKEVNQINQRFRDDFIKQLIKGEFSYNYVRHRSEEIGLELSPQSMVALARINQDKDFDDWKSFHFIFNYLKDKIKLKCELDITIGIEGNDTIILFIPWKSDGANSKKIIETLVEARLELTRNLENLQIAVGIGNPCNTYDRLPESFKEASIACQVSMALNEVCEYSELGSYSLLIELLDSKEIDNYLERLINPIITYDYENKTELFKTLETFIYSNCNYRETAKKLYIHHNTIRYRLSIIEKLLGFDLKDQEMALNVLLGIKLFKLKN
ncbi:MAG: hypothetical protein APF76_16295 [Desulfitibacter sp. BRH_c19]|nr:MAG: hypothetical protein APF76_16295 [Desulfitibacter sp. BRH_c19]